MASRQRSTLDPATLYEGDNGRVTCGALRCAGSSAHFTGRTIAGQRVRCVSLETAYAFRAELGYSPRCESCGREFTTTGGAR